MDSGSPPLDALFPVVYEHLKRLARAQLARERGSRVLQTTALVHEADVTLLDDTRVTRKGRAYFFAAAARAMRQILVDPRAPDQGAQARWRQARGDAG